MIPADGQVLAGQPVSRFTYRWGHIAPIYGRDLKQHTHPTAWKIIYTCKKNSLNDMNDNKNFLKSLTNGISVLYNYMPWEPNKK